MVSAISVTPVGSTKLVHNKCAVNVCCVNGDEVLGSSPCVHSPGSLELSDSDGCGHQRMDWGAVLG